MYPLLYIYCFLSWAYKRINNIERTHNNIIHILIVFIITGTSMSWYDGIKFMKTMHVKKEDSICIFTKVNFILLDDHNYKRSSFLSVHNHIIWTIIQWSIHNLIPFTVIFYMSKTYVLFTVFFKLFRKMFFTKLYFEEFSIVL